MAVKVNRSEIPLLVIGLGGTGKDTLLSIKRKFQERFNNLDPITKVPPHTAYLLLDDDPAGIGDDPEGLVKADCLRLHVEAIGEIFAMQSFTPEEQEWINPNLSTVAATDGAGGVRQLGRFQLFRNVDKVVSELQKKLDAILSAKPTMPPSTTSMNVLICSSLSGGTGSGTALDMAYIVKQVIKNSHAAYAANMKMYGIFVMPENIIKKAHLDTTRVEELKANAYAAMKEMDYWMRQPTHKQSMTVAYSGNFKAEWNDRPFNYLGYMGHTWEDGVAISDPYQESINKISELMLLLSSEVPQVTAAGALVEHNIYSNLSNADQQVTTLQGSAPYPVSISNMSLGMSEYSSDEVGVSDYEKEKTLELVMDVPTFNAKTGQPMSHADAELTGAELVSGILSLEQPIDEFFDNLKLGTQKIEEYMNGQEMPLLDFSNKKALQAAGQSYSQQIQNHYVNILPTARDYFTDYFNKLWMNFVEEAKKNIRNIQCGPVGFLQFLDKVYLNDLEGALADSADTVKKAEQTEIAERSEACDLAYNEALKTHLGLPGTAQEYLNNYQARAEELCAICWARCSNRAKQEALKDYRNKIKSYRDNLEMLIEALKLHMNECEKKELKAELIGDDLTFSQLKEYLDGSIDDPETVKSRDASIAKARDAVLERLADDSFRLPREKKADTHAKQEELKNEFVEMINQFVENAFQDIGLDNLDIVLEAASKIIGVEKEKYMANTVAPRMDQAARPTLHLKKTQKAKVKDYCNFRHTAVPRNAEAVQAGLKIYSGAGTAGGGAADFTVSDMTDRMLHLHMKLGIPMYMMNDIYQLRVNYEHVLEHNASDACMGIHLVNKVKSFNGLKEGKAYTLRQTWLKLPSPIPPVEIAETDLSPAEKSTIIYLENLLARAIESGIVTFSTLNGGEPYDGRTAAATLVNEVMRINGLQIGTNKNAAATMHPDDICKAIDEIFGNEDITEEDRLKTLQAMRENNVQQVMEYGRYVKSYASALGIQQIVPKETNEESQADRDRIAEDYKLVRSKLCAWMLSMYPEYLCLVERNLDAFAYLHDKEQILEKAISKKNRMYDLAAQFAVPFLARKLSLYITTFQIDNHGNPLELFDNDLEKIGGQEMKKYWESSFVLQYEEHSESFTPSVKQLVKETLEAYPADFKTLLKAKKLGEIETNFESTLAQWNDQLKSIRSDMNMEIQHRDALEKIYEKLVRTVSKVYEQYKLWKDSVTVEPAAPVEAAPIVAPAAEAVPAAAAPEPVEKQTASDASITSFPPQYVALVSKMSKAQRIAILKGLPEDRRMVLIGQLPMDQMMEALAEI